MGSSVQASNAKDVLVAWRRRLKKSWFHGIWKLVPLTIWWCTWKESNQRIFEGKASSLQDCKLYFLRLLYSWSQVLDGSSSMSSLDFVDKTIHESLKAW